MARANIEGLASTRPDPDLLEDWHVFHVDTAEERENRNNPDYHLYLELSVVEGPSIEVENPDGTVESVNPAGRKVFVQLPYPSSSHKDGGKLALQNLKAFLDAAGVEYDDQGFDIEELQGVEVQGRIKQREFEGENRPDVRRWKPA